MNKFNVGDTVIAIFTQKLPGKETAPKLKHKEEYTVKSVYIDMKGNQHIDVGLDMDVSFIKSFETNEELPSNIRWCHPNRFILKSSLI